MSFEQRLRANNNEFWQCARHHHLDDLLEGIYRDERKRALLRRWIGAGQRKVVLLRQLDFDSDPLQLELTSVGWRVAITESPAAGVADVELIATHAAIISSFGRLSSCLRAWLRGDVRMPGVRRRPRDHYFAARLLLGQLSGRWTPWVSRAFAERALKRVLLIPTLRR